MRVGLPNALVRQGACAWRLTGATRPDSFLDYSGLTPIDPARHPDLRASIATQYPTHDKFIITTD
jgi:hypothetical protein